MATDPHCQRAHAKISGLGFCPWCRRWINKGQPVGPGDSVAPGDPVTPKSYEDLKRLIHQKLVDNMRNELVKPIRNDLKRLIHQKLVDKLDLFQDLEGDALRRELRLVVERLCDTENPLLNRMERERLIDEVLDEVFGAG